MGSTTYEPLDINNSSPNSTRSKLGAKLTAYIALFVAIFSMAAVGPTFLYLERQGVKPLTATCWRQQAMCLFLIPPTIWEWRKYVPSERKQWFTRQPMKDCAWVGLGWAASVSLWVIALEFTTTVRASLFTSLPPLILVAYFRLTGKPVSGGEIGGCLISLLGIVVCVLTKAQESGDTSAEAQKSGAMALAGDFMCLIASFFLAANIIFSARARQIVPLFVYTAGLSILILIFTCVCSLMFYGADWSVTTNGLFGWMQSEFAALVLLFGLVVGLIGILGFNYSVKYVSPLLFSISQLLDPVVTGVISWAAGLEGIPNGGTLSGGIIIGLGIAVVVWAESKRKKMEELNGGITSNGIADLPPSLQKEFELFELQEEGRGRNGAIQHGNRQQNDDQWAQENEDDEEDADYSHAGGFPQDDNDDEFGAFSGYNNNNNSSSQRDDSNDDFDLDMNEPRIGRPQW